MKSKCIAAAFMLLASVPAFAAGPVANRHIDRGISTDTGVRAPLAHAGWVSQASPAEVEASLEAEATRRQTYPAVLVETSSYAYQAGDEIELYLTLDPNGYNAPVSFYLYQQDRMSGEKTYYNVFDGFGDDEIDLFGAADAPVAVNLPAFDRFQLFGGNGALGQGISAPSGAARLQHVFEVRNADGSRVLSKSTAKFNIVNSISPVSGDITSDRTLSWDTAWVLQGAVFVRNGATLTIDPGTVIYGEGVSLGTLVVARGGKIHADGTNMNPIVMTSELPLGERGRANWGGLIINGRAPVNIGTGIGEGDTGEYGGNDPNDNSGVLRYIRVEYAGIEFSPDNELNGIAFQGVGRGTIVDHVQVHFNKDDGVEFFGGTVNARYLLLTSNGDDNIDWVEGWTGNLQFAAVVQSGDDADQGIEADNKDADNSLLPRSNPSVYNVTLVGGDASGNESDDGILLREGTAGKIYNSIVTGFGETHVAIRNSSTFAQAASGDLVVNNNIFWMNAEEWDEDSNGVINADGAATRDLVLNTWTMNRIVDPMLASPFMLIQPDLSLLEGSPALDVKYVKTPPDNGFFDTTVDYLGAIAPGNDWVLDGWATFSRD